MQPICIWTEDQLRKNLKHVLLLLKMDTKKYSWHSFRRGGATLASKRNVDGAVIKTHGRWLSDAYLLYVDRDHEHAGQKVSDVL